MHAPHDLGVHQGLAWELAVPFLLVVVVQRRTEEQALAGAGGLAGELEPQNLEQHGAGFGDDDDAHDGQEQSRLHQDEHDADGGAKAHGARVAHVDFGGRAVEPQVGKQGACNGGGDGEQFVAARQVGHAQVLAEDEVSAHVGHETYEHHAGEDRHRNEAVQAVGEVCAVCAGRDDKCHEGDKNPVGQVQLEHVDGEEGYGQVALEFWNELVAEDGHNEAKEEVEEQAEAAGDAVGLVHVVGGLELAQLDEALGLDFGDIVDGAHGGECRQDDQGGNAVAVHLADQERDDLDDDYQKETAHDGRALGSVLVKIGGGVKALEFADIDRHEAHD